MRSVGGDAGAMRRDSSEARATAAMPARLVWIETGERRGRERRGARAAAARGGAVGPIGDVRVSTRTGAVIVNIVAGVERGAGVGARRGARERGRWARAWNAAVVSPVTGRVRARPYAARGSLLGRRAG